MRRIVILLTALAAALSLTIRPASATGWIISEPHGTLVWFSGLSVSLVSPGGATLACEEHYMGGALINRPDPRIALLNDQGFTRCGGPFGMVFEMYVSNTWELTAISPTADPDVNNVVLTNISLHLNGPACSASFTGSIPGTYDNETAELHLDGTGSASLTASSVSGCLGIVRNGDIFTWTGDYLADPPFTLHME
ncbi:hypothetical protein [Spirillospora sp. NPDC029432]|uniref:hypothetical protein n=1 Tax=Spirillospora sp. NPDC029432 TaxID=3154599 RepID=UPI003455260C